MLGFDPKKLPNETELTEVFEALCAVPSRLAAIEATLEKLLVNSSATTSEDTENGHHVRDHD